MNIKEAALKSLANERKNDRQTELSRTYHQVGDFHNGIYDLHNHVSPWSNSACNVNSKVMIIAQDWSSEEILSKPPKNPDLGYDPTLPTNINLQLLLKEFFNLEFKDTYATNLFVFVKAGGISSKIPMKDMVYSAKKYAIPQIEIVNPDLILCLGKQTFTTLCKALELEQPAFKTAASHPVAYRNSVIFGIPHTGGLGTKNAGGFSNVKKIWADIANFNKIAQKQN
jgi:restriction system protein